ncbi:MAG: AAA family ATPase, partial [Planctomycetota bacterium]
MYLKKLMISGFKSFADPIELHFHSGTTAIVGPNGCGKSNVVDAFRWVLGERSAKELRGEEMMDVIFKGTPHRPPLSRAEVSLLFDNADGRLPVEFSEVEIARRLYRSGESEYLINKRRCRLKDVQALIADTGIGTEGYSVFEQGNVDAFLLSSPQERRKLFEEAAGISRFKKQRRKALSQLERVEANLTRLTDILAEVEKRVRSVKYQAGRARRFLKDRERMGRLRSVIAAAEIDELRRDREVISFRLSSTQVERGLIARLAARFERGRESARRGVESAGQTLASLRDEEMRLRVELERKQQRLSHIGERREEIGDATLKRKAMGQELQRVVEEYSGRRAEVRERIREEISRLRGARARFDEGEERRRSLSEEGSRLDHHIRTAKEEALSQVFTQTRLSNEEISQKSDLRGLDALRERRIREREEFEAQLRELKGAREGLTRGLHETREGAAVAARRLALLEGEVESRSRTLDEKKQALSALNASLEGCGARLRFLEGLEASREGVGKGAQRLLSLDHPISAEVVGLLAGCIEADPEIAPLVDAVLGSVSETVMLRGSTPLGDRAQVVAEVLDGEGVGICHVEGRPSGSSGGGEGPGDGGKSLFELIRCDPIYRATLRRIFGNVEVVENLATALERRARSGGGRRFVTRDGILVEPWGGILLPGRNGGGLVSRRAEIEQLQGRMGVLEDELLHARDQGTALERSIDARMGELRGAREEIQRLRLDREHLERRLGENRRESERSRERIEVIKVEIREMDAERERILEALSEVRKGLEGVGEERARLEREVAEGEERLASLNERATEVEERVSGLRVESSQREERLVSLRREEHRILAEVRDRGERLDHIEEEEREARRRLAEHAEEERELRASEEDLEH